MIAKKVCDDDDAVAQFVIFRFPSLNKLSQESARLLLGHFDFSDPVWETKGRVDLIVTSDSKKCRIEIKFISKLNENRNRLIDAIRKTKTDIATKKLDFLLITTIAKKFSMQEGFKRFKGYCVLGILVSKVEIEETPPELLANEILKEGRSVIGLWDEFTSMYQEQLLQHSKDIEKLSELNQDQTKHINAVEGKVDSLETKMDSLETKMDSLETKVETKVDSLETKVDSLENKVETKVDSLENKVDSLENKVDSLENKVDSLENKAEELRNDLGNLHDKVDNVLSILIEFVEKKNGNEH